MNQRTHRLPPVAMDKLSDEQRKVYDQIASGPRGQIGAPHWVWLRSPRLAAHAQEYGRFCRFETILDPAMIEIAILTTAAHWKAPLEWDLHEPEAIKAGIDPITIEAIRTESAPVFDSPQHAAVYQFAYHLLKERVSSDDEYEKVLNALGEQATVELVGILGYYALISMTIVSFKVPSHLRSKDSFEDLRN